MFLQIYFYFLEIQKRITLFVNKNINITHFFMHRLDTQVISVKIIIYLKNVDAHQRNK